VVRRSARYRELVSNVIWAAAIAGAVGLLSNIPTYMSARRSADVELARVRAESERLREQHREAERQNRQGTYHRVLAALNRFDMIATGYPFTSEEFDQLVDGYNALVGGIFCLERTPFVRACSRWNGYFERSALRPASPAWRIMRSPSPGPTCADAAKSFLRRTG
jgi:hypothetical protein